ncbi:hypothetical protein [Petrimonas sp.]|uniref:hypothetical protein n=1 Tax=Petrimonas sp. TaxID=2023866 RepID=UPI003F511CB3
MRKKEFTIVAGANGVGKSTLKDRFIRPDTEYFNGDIVFAQLIEKYPHLSREQLEGGVARSLENAVEKAIRNKTDFAFETNFSSNMPIYLTKKFRENDFNVNLLYIGVDSLNICKQRVLARVLKGGHQIEDWLIEENYREGIKKTSENLLLFDNITFVDSKLSDKSEIVALLRKGITKIIINNNCEWFNTHFKSAFNALENP